jgi:outer membrane protein assembly factor BamA
MRRCAASLRYAARVTSSFGRALLSYACALGLLIAAGGARAAESDGHDASAAQDPKDEAVVPSKAAAPPPIVEQTHVHYTLEGIEIRGNARTAARVVLRYVKFRAGDVLDVDDAEIELTRYRLLGTGFFTKVELSLRRGSRRGAAVLVIDVTERNTLVMQQLWLGIASDQDAAGKVTPITPFIGLEAAETNLAGTGITLGAGLGLATDQLAIRTRFLDPAFAGTSWSAGVSLLYNDARDFFGTRSVLFESPLLEQREVTDYAVVAYKRFGGTLSTGHDLSVASQFQLDYHLEQIDATVPTVASQLRGGRDEPIDFSVMNGKSVLSTLRGIVSYDTRDAPFLAKQGTLASLALTVGMTPLGSDYGYEKVEIAAQRWWQLPWKHVVRLEAYAGGIAGRAPFFEKFYVGDFTDLLPDRVLDLNPDRRPAPNFLNTDIVEVRYGDFAAKLAAEYRIPLYKGRGSIYGVDLFATAGIYGVATKREFTDPALGYTGFHKVPIDFTYRLGLRVDTAVGGITLAFSDLLVDFIPATGGGARK